MKKMKVRKKTKSYQRTKKKVMWNSSLKEFVILNTFGPWYWNVESLMFEYCFLRRAYGRGPCHSSQEIQILPLPGMPVVDSLAAHTVSAGKGDQDYLDSNLIRFKQSSSNVFSITKTAILSKAYLVSKIWCSSSPFGNSRNFQKGDRGERVINLKPFLSTET